MLPVSQKTFSLIDGVESQTIDRNDINFHKFLPGEEDPIPPTCSSRTSINQQPKLRGLIVRF